MSGTGAAERLVVACAADEGYAPGLAVTLGSTLSASTSDRVLCAILDMGMSPGTKKRIERLVGASGRAEIRWLDPGQSLNKTATRRHFSRAIYARLLLGHLLPDVSRCLYLDSDLLITGDLSEIAATDLGPTPLAAVEGRAGPNVRALMARLLDGRDWSGRYFNSGVLVMDLDAFRARRIGKEAIAFCEAHADDLLFPDQDALNVLLVDDWTPLEPRWNMIVKPGRNPDLTVPGVLHFVGAEKPWTAKYRAGDAEIADAYAKYLAQLTDVAILPRYRTTALSLRNRFRRFRRGV